MEEPSSDTLPASQAGGGERFAGRYRVLGRLGRGASKEVYLAHDDRLDRDVALALVVGARTRVEREAQITGRLGDHPNVVTVYDAGEHDGVPYLVLRAMPGGSLAEAAERLVVEDAIRIGAQIASALAHVHAHGVVHRDVKPDNVWLDADGNAALGDFGVAFAEQAERLTLEGAVVGTARYLSPEQARGEPVGPSADLYALGVTLYELLTGRLPFTGPDAASVLAQHLVAQPEPPSRYVTLPPALDRLVLELLGKRPEARPASAEAVAATLRAMLERPSASVLPRDPAFVGRDDVMAALNTAWAEAVSGRPRLIALAGEPGIGKTRCVEELARSAGAAVAWGRCAEHEGVPAYWPWLRALRALGAESVLERAHDGSQSAEEARFRLFDSVVEALERATAERPALIALDDLHWADRSSLELLTHAARELRGGRVLLVLTYREGELRGDHPLRGALAELSRNRAFERRELRGLAPDDVARYVEHVTGRPADGMAAAVYARTDGNPFFVGELVRTLPDDGDLDRLPAAVRDVVAARVARLTPPARALLDAAATAGRDASLTVVAAAARLSRSHALEALDAAATEQLLDREAAPRCRFTHAIVRDVVYDAIGIPRRAALHSGLADAIAERGDGLSAEVAHHRLEAARAGGDPEPALEAALAAAREAAARLALGEAADHHEAALEAFTLSERRDERRRCDLLLGVAAAHATAGDVERARDRYREAAATARRLGPDGAALLADAALGFAEWQMYGVVDDEAIGLLRDALAGLEAGDSAARARLLGRLAVRLDRQTDQPTREALIDEALAIARRLPEDPGLTRLLALSTLVHGRPESVARRLDDSAETIERARSAGDREAMLWAHTVRYADALTIGDVATADTELAAQAALTSDLRHPYYHWWLGVLEAGRAIFAGRLDEGRRLAEEAAGRNRTHDADSGQELAVQRLALAVAGERPADAALPALIGFAERYPHLPVWPALAAYAELVIGEHERARARFDAMAASGFADPDRDPDAIAALAFAAETCAALGDAARAAELYERLAPYADHNVVVDRGWAAWGAAAHQLGLLARTLGDEERAADHLARAAGLNRTWGADAWQRRSERQRP